MREDPLARYTGMLNSPILMPWPKRPWYEQVMDVLAPLFLGLVCWLLLMLIVTIHG